MLLHHIWVNYKHTCPQLQQYHELCQMIQLTPRIWNPNVKLHDLLKHLTWTLYISINLIGFKKKQPEHQDNFQCGHIYKCYLPYYKFQNPHVRLCQDHCKEFLQINILEYKFKL